MLTYKVLWTQDLDSPVAEFILSRAEGLLRNDMDRFEKASGEDWELAQMSLATREESQATAFDPAPSDETAPRISAGQLR